MSRIADVTPKEGRSGTLVFVTVRHEIADARGLAIVDEHDIVYRDSPRPTIAAPRRAARRSKRVARAKSSRSVLLFRYSALTFNGHRIHYDRRYVTEVEGYPGLVVHGPLLATLLLDLLRREQPARGSRTSSSGGAAGLRRCAVLRVRPAVGRRQGRALWAQDHRRLVCDGRDAPRLLNRATRMMP